MEKEERLSYLFNVFALKSAVLPRHSKINAFRCLTIAGSLKLKRPGGD